MEFSYPVGRVIVGETQAVREAYAHFQEQPVDVVDLCEGDAGYSARRTTLGGERSAPRTRRRLTKRSPGC